MDRDGSMVSTNYSLSEFFWELLDPAIHGMLSLQDDYGIPMWGVLLAASLGVRVLVLPLTIKAMRAGALVAQGAPRAVEIQERMKEAKARGNPIATKRLEEEWYAYHRNSQATIFTPFKYMIPQAAVFLYMYMSIRRLVDEHAPELMDSGILWFQNLASYDPYCRLPLISAAIFAINFEFLNDQVMKPQQQNIMRATLGAMSLGGAYITYEFALGLHWYWTSSIFFTVLINFVLRRTPLRDYFQIPRPTVTTPTVSPLHVGPSFKTIKDEVTFAQKPRRSNKTTIINPTKISSNSTEVKK